MMFAAFSRLSLAFVSWLVPNAAVLLGSNKAIRLAGGALETFNILSLKLLLRNRANWGRFSGAVFREYMRLVGTDRWSAASIEALVDCSLGRRIVLEHLPGEGIYTPVDELAYLALITASINPSRVFEIGTFRGRTALNFALNSHPDCQVFTLDLPPDGRDQASNKSLKPDAAIIERSRTGIDYQGKPEAEKIVQLYGNSMEFDFSPYQGNIDIVFIDGAHHYEAVVSDTRNALRMLAPGGVVLWHDFANYGDYNDVTRAVVSLLPGKQVVQIASSQLAVYRKEGFPVQRAPSGEPFGQPQVTR